MSDYHKDKIKEQGKQIAMLEAELARVTALNIELHSRISAIFDYGFPQDKTVIRQAR